MPQGWLSGPSLLKIFISELEEPGNRMCMNSARNPQIGKRERGRGGSALCGGQAGQRCVSEEEEGTQWTHLGTISVCDPIRRD